MVSKPPLGPDLGVGARRLILKIPHVFLRLNASPRPALTLNPIEGFETTSKKER